MIIATRAEIGALLRFRQEDLMYFEVKRATRPGQPLTRAQRTSSHFSEEPTIGGRTLRRGIHFLRFTEAQFAAVLPQVKQLFRAGAIEVFAVNGEDRSDLRKAIEDMKKDQGLSELSALHKVLPPNLGFAADELMELMHNGPKDLAELPGTEGLEGHPADAQLDHPPIPPDVGPPQYAVEDRPPVNAISNLPTSENPDVAQTPPPEGQTPFQPGPNVNTTDTVVESNQAQIAHQELVQQDRPADVGGQPLQTPSETTADTGQENQPRRKNKR